MRRHEDITVRIQADYAKALQDVQRFTGSAGQSFGTLPKAVQQSSSAVDSLTGKIGQMGASNAPRNLALQTAQLPKTFQTIGVAVDGITVKLDRLAGSYAPQKLRSDLDQLPPIIQRLTGSIDALTAKVDKLGQEDGPTELGRKLRRTNEEASALQKTLGAVGTAGKVIGAGAAGFMAGKAVFQPHMERMLDYDTKLAHLANVTYAGRDVKERLAGKDDLNKVISDAVRIGGGTREGALDTLNRLISSGTVKDAEAKAMLPSVVKASTASGASPEAIADIGIRAMQNFGLKATDLPKIIDMAIMSGNVGGFELKDMAKWLPAQMAEAASLGMKGEKGFAQLLALNQAAITTAGSTDAAGNNVANLLAKINGTDTQQDFKKLGINLSGSLQNAVGKGIDPVTAFAHLIDQVMSKDKNYVALERKRKSATSNEEQASILEQQLQLAEGTAIGKVLQDRQARGAFLGFKKQGDAYQQQIEAVLNGSTGTTEKNFAVVSQSPGFVREQAMNDQLGAQHDALKKLVPALEAYWSGTSKIAREYPVLSTAIEGGKIAFVTAGAAAGSASIVLALLTRNAAAASAALGGIAATGGGKNLTGGAYGSHMGKFGKALNLVGSFGVGWEIGTLLNDHVINPLAKKASGGKSDSLGTLIYDLTSQNKTSPAVPAPVVSTPGVPSSAGQLPAVATQELPASAEQSKVRQLGNLTMPQNDLEKALTAGLKPAPLAMPVPEISSLKPTSPTSVPPAAVLQQQLLDGLKPLPVDAKLKVDIAFTETGKPYVTSQRIEGRNIRLDTGPMMTP